MQKNIVERTGENIVHFVSSALACRLKYLSIFSTKLISLQI